jgi:hypothetical protein
MNESRIVYLEISSFIGRSFGAIHYYGCLSGHCPEYKKVRLERKLSAREAAELNKVHDWRLYREGYLYEGFDTKDEIMHLALSDYKKHFPDADILIMGSSAIADPQPVLDGPPDFKDMVNAWVDEADRIGGYEGNETVMHHLSDTYWKYMQRYLEEQP